MASLESSTPSSKSPLSLPSSFSFSYSSLLCRHCLNCGHHRYRRCHRCLLQPVTITIIVITVCVVNTVFFSFKNFRESIRVLLLTNRMVSTSTILLDIGSMTPRACNYYYNPQLLLLLISMVFLSHSSSYFDKYEGL